MLINLLLWSLEAIIIFLYGRLTIRLLGPIASTKEQQNASILLTFLAGLVMVTTLASLLSLWINLGAEALIILTFGALLILAWDWKANRLQAVREYIHWPTNGKLWLVIGIIFVGMILDLSSRRPANPDTGIYHAQAIRWMETYPAVPGLGNLHTRFAYNSSWLVANSLFSFSFLGFQSFHALPGLFFTAFAFYALKGFYNIFKRIAQPSDWFKSILLVLAFFTIIVETSSPGTDLPAILFVWLLAGELLTDQENPQEQPFRPVITALTSVFAITVKLSVAPMALFTVTIFIKALFKRAWKTVGAIALGSILILIPWFSRNVVVSGYLLFPEPSMDWFDVDWKIPTDIASREKEIIQSWARIPREDSDTVQAMPLATWSYIWYLNKSFFEKVFLWGILILPLGFLIGSFLMQKMKTILRMMLNRYGWTYLTVYLGLLFWFISAPDIRFGYGFLLAALALTILPWLLLFDAFLLKISKYACYFMILVCVTFWGLLYRSIEPSTLFQRILIPKDYPTLSTSPCELRNKTILCAEWYHECWYKPFPCVPSANPNVGLRGEGLSQGFRYNKD